MLLVHALKRLKMYSKLLILFLMIQTSSVSFAGLNEANRYYQNKQYQSAIAEYLPLAMAGSEEAQVQLGIIHTFGYGVKIDYPKALSFF